LVTPFAHALLWAMWKFGVIDVCASFEQWLKLGVVFEEVNALDLLLMDKEWRKDSLDGQLLAMVGRINPSVVLREVIHKASSGAQVLQCAKFAAGGCGCPVAGAAASGAVLASAAEPLDAIRWLQKGGEAKGWS